MLSLLYVSSAARPFSAADLTGLLEDSRRNNGLLDITGVLLYKDGTFLQVIEGPDTAVEQLFQVICSDPRHRAVERLLERQIEQRQFPESPMAFQDLNDPALRDIPGFHEFMNQPLDVETLRSDPYQVSRLFELFRRITTSSTPIR